LERTTLSMPKRTAFSLVWGRGRGVVSSSKGEVEW
jgi:hypothetical protein